MDHEDRECLAGCISFAAAVVSVSCYAGTVIALCRGVPGSWMFAVIGYAAAAVASVAWRVRHATTGDGDDADRLDFVLFVVGAVVRSLAWPVTVVRTTVRVAVSTARGSASWACSIGREAARRVRRRVPKARIHRG